RRGSAHGLRQGLSEALQRASSSALSQQSRRQPSKPFSVLIQFAAAYQPTVCGRFTSIGRTFVQSSPSMSASNCAWFSRTRVGVIFGQQNCVSSSVLANRHTPLPSHQTALIRSALFDRNTYSAPLNGSAPPSRTSAIKPIAPLRKSTGVLATYTLTPAGIMPAEPPGSPQQAAQALHLRPRAPQHRPSQSPPTRQPNTQIVR